MAEEVYRTVEELNAMAKAKKAATSFFKYDEKLDKIMAAPKWDGVAFVEAKESRARAWDRWESAIWNLEEEQRQIKKKADLEASQKKGKRK